MFTATIGALWSSWTMSVRPLSSTNFWFLISMVDESDGALPAGAAARARARKRGVVMRPRLALSAVHDDNSRTAGAELRAGRADADLGEGPQGGGSEGGDQGQRQRRRGAVGGRR